MLKRLAPIVAVLILLLGSTYFFWSKELTLPLPPPPITKDPPQPPSEDLARVQAEDLRKAMASAREEAAKEKAETLVPKSWAAAADKEHEGDAAFGKQDFASARAAYGDAQAAYAKAANEAIHQKDVAARISRVREQQDQAAQARSRAQGLGAATLAGDLWNKALGLEKSAERALERQELDKAIALAREAEQAFRAAGDGAEKQQSEEARAAAEAASEARKARQAAEQVEAARYAASLFAQAEERLKLGRAASGARDHRTARERYLEARDRYQQAKQEAEAEKTGLVGGQRDAEQSRDRMVEARSQAEQADARRLAAKLYQDAAAKESDAQGLFARADTHVAQQRLREAQQEYERAKQRFGDAQREYEKAAREARAVAKDLMDKARDQAVASREQADQADADKLAKDLFDAARAKEAQADGLGNRQDYAAATPIYQDAVRGYEAALRRARELAALPRSAKAVEDARRAAEEQARRLGALQGKTQMDAARLQMNASRDAAIRAEADKLAKELLDGAQRKEGQADTLARRAAYGEASAAYRDAAQAYYSAAYKAGLLRHERALADQARMRMQAEKQKARPDAPDYAAGVAQESQGDTSYGRLAFKDAAGHYDTAQGLFAKATTAKALPSVDPSSEILAVLNAYKKAIEGKDLGLYRQVYPGVSKDSLRKVEQSFQQMQSQSLDFRDVTIDITGDDALVRGRRIDGLVPKGGKEIRRDSAFAMRLRRTPPGWVILGITDVAELRPAPTVPSAETLVRHPTMEAPGAVAVGQEFPLQVSLTEARVTPTVQVEPRTGEGVQVTPGGALVLPLPPPAPGQDTWPIDVVVSAPGFSVRGSSLATIRLPRHGDSTPALFQLRADPVTGASQSRRLTATLHHNGAYLARISRTVTVTAGAPPAAAGPAPAVTAERGRGARFEPDASAADLTVFVLDRDDGTGTADVIVTSPHLRPTKGTLTLPRELPRWLDTQYDRFVAELTSGLSRDRTVPLLRGFGRELYRRFAPPAFKDAFWKLRDLRKQDFQSIQIYSDNPLLPWELMRPSRADGSDEGDFLGIDFRIARWHVTESTGQLDRAPQAIALKELVVVAPRYQGAQALPSQQLEMRALQSIRGFRQQTARLASIQALFRSLPDGIIHFAGHGVVKPTRAGAEYLIQLEDSDLDVQMFRGMTATRAGGHPFIFFNACSIGQAQRITNFVDGWAPAALEAGASGYVGGLWLLSDAGAAEFAVQFYRSFGDSLRQGPIRVSDLLRTVRSLFYDRGDPTFLAYVYYGDPHFRFVPSGGN